VVGHACETCPAGTENAAGGDASGTDTTCHAIKCTANQRVVDHACSACPAGTEHSAGGDASGADTTCAAIHCAKNQYVKSHACNACPAGSTNAAGDDASGADTKCDPTRCAANKKVVSNECRGCPAGKSNAKGDDASKGNSLCDAIKCGENQHVQGHACIACSAGKKNKAGDDASGANTVCDAIKCGTNQYVRRNACVSCASKSINRKGDDASGPDTKCYVGCTVTTYKGPRCGGSVVKTYHTYTAKELKWTSGAQLNTPVSAKVSGECTRVEFYDQDNNQADNGDNMNRTTPGCTTFTWDIKQDLGGLKIISKVPMPTGKVACTGVTLYWHSRQGGDSLFKGVGNTAWIGYTWNDQATSVKVPSGCGLYLYQHKNYGGVKNYYGSGKHHLRRNDDASSLKVVQSSAR